MTHLRSTLLILLLPACISTTVQRDATTSLIHTEKPTNNAQIIFQFERSGGFAGLDEAWTLFEDGNFISATGDAYSLAQEEIINIIELISSIDANSLQITPEPFSSCADCFRYKLIVSRESSKFEFVWGDGDEVIPEGLIKILAKINAFIIKATQN